MILMQWLRNNSIMYHTLKAHLLAHFPQRLLTLVHLLSYFELTTVLSIDKCCSKVVNKRIHRAYIL